MWYALVHDEQLGPMPDTELAELHTQGVVSDSTLVWTATMSDWRPVSEVAEIQALIADPDFLDEEEGEGATMMMSPGDGDWAAMLGVQSAPPEPERPAIQVQRAAPEAATEMLSAELIADDLEPLPAAAGGLLGPAPAPPMPMPDFGADEPVGGSIIDRFPDAPPAPEVAAADDADAFMVPTTASVPPSSAGRSKLPLILLALLLIGGGAAAWVILSGDDPVDVVDQGVAAATDAPTTDAPTTDAPSTVAAATASVPDAGVEGADSDAMVLALADLEPESPPTDAPSSAAPDSAAPETAAPESTAPKTAAPRSAAPKTAPKRAPATKARTPRTPPKAPKSERRPRTPVKPPNTNDKSLPVQLSRDHITGVLRKSGARLRTCAALDDKVKEGTFSVNVVIKRSGVVHSAKVVTGRLRKSPAAKCIEGQVKRFRFGRFSGDPMRIQLPFRL